MILINIEKADKGKYCLLFDKQEPLFLYWKEFQKYQWKPGCEVNQKDYEALVHEVLGKRATKRAMHILEKKDHTEKQLRDKLEKNQYPQEALDAAMEYVKGYRYVDDYRYACVYIQYYQESRNRRRIEQDLYKRGIPRDIMKQALDEEFNADEEGQIAALLKKRRFQYISERDSEFRKTYQYLQRRGYSSSAVLKKMKESGESTF